MSSLADVISVVSEYEVGTGKDITTDQLAILVSITQETVNRLNTPGFTGDDLLLFQAYIVLDIWENRPGTGQIVNQTVFQNTWEVKPDKTSSMWMDRAYQMVAEYNATRTVRIPLSGVERSDAHMSALRFDNLYVPSYGEPSESDSWKNCRGL